MLSNCEVVTLPIGILGQMWCLIVPIPDPCPLSYFVYGRSQEFKVNIGVHHGSELRPLLFIIVMEWHLCYTLELPVRISMQIILSSLLNCWGNVSGGS